jgi:hypothetical protein
VSTHAYHEGQPSFDAGQIMHDGCEECEYRATTNSRGIGFLDRNDFERAWRRAAEWNTTGISSVSKAEAPLLDVLWAVQCQLENFGHEIGEIL